MPANDTLPRFDMAARSVTTALASAGAVYGLWAALFCDGGTAGLALFATVACIGVVRAVLGLHRRSRFITDSGLLLAALAPVGFVWISSVASPFVGATLLFREVLERRK